MNLNYFIPKFKSNTKVLLNLLDVSSEEEQTWRSQPEKWCLLEILCHLIDEEKEDFRMRIKTTLESPGTLPPPIDPEGWVKGRNYIDQDYASRLQEFERERKISVTYLESLDNPNWQNSYIHESLGELSAGLFLENWLAHDYMHIRQILRLKFAHLQSNAEHSLDYAGIW